MDEIKIPVRAKLLSRATSENEVYIGRPSKWGNPFVIGRDGTREEVVEKYRQHLWKRKDLLAQLEELNGKRIKCYCNLTERCHGDVLVAAFKWRFQCK